MALKAQGKTKNLTAILQQWNKVVGLSGHKNVRSAKESYRVMEAKLGLSSGGPPSSPTKVKKRTGKIGTKGRGKKASKKEELDGGEDADDGEDGIGSEGEKALAQDDEMEEGV